MGRITDSAYPTVTSAAANDLLMLVDVDNFAENPAGTTSKITVGGLLTGVSFFNIVAFGADPSGMTDSTAAITAAKAAAGSGSRNIILVPPGTYLTNPFTFDGFHWLGYGPRSSILKANASSSNFATNNQAATNEVETVIEGLGFDGTNLTGSAAVVLLGNNFFGTTAPTVIMRDCWAYNGPGIGIDTSLLRGGLSGGGYFERIITHDNAGHGLSIGSDSIYVGCVSENNGKAGYYINGVSSFSMLGCKAYSNGVSYPGGGAAYGYGFELTGQSTGAVLTGCLAQDNINSGVAFISAQGYVVTGLCADSNSATTAGTYPAVAFSSSTGNIIEYTAIDRNYNGGSGGNCQLNALTIDSGSTGNTIKCGAFYKTAGSSSLSFLAIGSGNGAGNFIRLPGSTGDAFLCPPVQYAPGTRATFSTSSATLSAVSSANINTGSFIAPASGSILVTASLIAANATGGNTDCFALAAHGTTSPVLGSTPVFAHDVSANPVPYTLLFLVTGLTAGSSYNLDLLYCSPATSALTVYALGSTSANTIGAPVLMTVQAV